MKRSVWSAALIAGVVALSGIPHDANAATVSILSQDIANLPAAGSIVNPLYSSASGSVFYGLSGPSVANQYRSPFEDFASPHNIASGYSGVAYTSIGSGASGSATYNFTSPMDMLTILWGSPDSYNTLNFYSSIDGGGSLIGSFTGSNLLINTFGHDLVTFVANGGTFSSVVLSSTQAAFEFADLRAEAPLPAALPLFATGLGVMGYLARRRKKRMSGAAMAVAA